MMQVTGAENHALTTAQNVSSVKPTVVVTRTNTPKQQEIQEHDTLTDEEIDKILKDMQQLSSNLGNKLEFSVNDSLGQVVVKVVDPETDKVIKEIPPVALQKMQIRIKEALGILFDDLI